MLRTGTVAKQAERVHILALTNDSDTGPLPLQRITRGMG